MANVQVPNAQTECFPLSLRSVLFVLLSDGPVPVEHLCEELAAIVGEGPLDPQARDELRRMDACGLLEEDDRSYRLTEDGWREAGYARRDLTVAHRALRTLQERYVALGSVSP